MSRLRKPSFFVPVMIAFLLGVAGMYVLHPPAASAQRTSLASLEATINDLTARLAVVEEGIFDADIAAAGDITAGGDLAAGGGVKVGATPVAADTKNVGMLRWNSNRNGLEVSDGTEWAPVAPESYVDPRVQRDFLTWTWQPDWYNAPFVDIKTNIPGGGSVMYRIAVEGYNFEAERPIDAVAVGYTYGGDPTNIRDQYVYSFHSGTNISQFISNDGFVVIRLSMSKIWYSGFSASAWFTSKPGEGFQISAVVQVP